VNSGRVTIVVEAIDKFSSLFSSFKSNITKNTNAVSLELDRTKKKIAELTEVKTKERSIDSLKRTMMDLQKNWSQSEFTIRKTELALNAVNAHVRALAKKASTAKENFERLKTQSGSTKEQIQKAKFEMRDFNEQLKTSQKEASSLKSKIEDSARSMAKSKELMAEKKIKISELSEGFHQERASVSKLSLELERHNSILREQKAIYKSMQNLDLKKREARLAYDLDIKRASMLGVAGMAATSFGKGVFSSAQRPLELAMNLDKELATLRAVSVAFDHSLSEKAKSEIMTGFKEQALNLSSSGFSSSEVAKGMFGLATAGFNPKEIQNSIASIMDLAKAGGVGIEAATEISTSTLRAFKLNAATDMGKVADIIASTANATNASVESIAYSMKYIAPNAKAAGVSLGETATMIGLLSNVGIKGEQAGTTLRGGLLKLIAPSKAAKEELNKLGIKIGDKNQNMRRLPEILEQIRLKTKGMGNIKSASILKTLFDVEALTGMQNLIEQMEPVWNESAKTWVRPFDLAQKQITEFSGAASKVAFDMSNNAADSWKRFSASLDTLKIRVSDALLPSLSQGLQKITTQVQKVSAWMKENPAFAKALSVTTLAVGGVAVAFGTVASALGALGVAASVGRFGIRSIGMELTRLRGLGAFLGPLGAALSFVPDALEGFKTGSFMKALFGGVESSLGLQALKWGSLGATIGSFIAPGMGTALGGALGASVGVLGGYLTTQTLTDLGKALERWFQSTLPKVGQFLGEIFGKASAHASFALKNLFEAVTSPQWWAKVAHSIWNFVKGIFDGIRTISSKWVSLLLSGDPSKGLETLLTSETLQNTFKNFSSGASQQFSQTSLALASLPNPQKGGKGGLLANHTFQTSFTINASPGMSEELLAAKVREQVELSQREAAARLRGRTFDGF